MSSREKKPLLMSLPDDLLLNCIARISRLYYPTLSLVSKTFRSLLASPELYKTRSLVNNTEICLYVCVQISSLPFNYRWFTLYRKPDQTLTWATVPVSHSRPVNFPGIVAVGSDIYHISNSIFGYTSCRVSILDCMSHTLRDAPTLQEKLCELSASVVDEKIYVSGSYINGGGSLKKSYEVFDKKSQVWNPCNDREVIACNSKEARQALIGQGNGVFMLPDSYCEIDNVLYCAFYGEIRWYDTILQAWRTLDLVGQPLFFGYVFCVRLADYGGKMAVFWEEEPHSGSKKKTIWCAVIALEKLKESCDIFGKVEWRHCMLTVPRNCELVKALAVTV